MKVLNEGLLILNKFSNLDEWNAKRWVKATRGLRQGEPLSPFLFTLAINVLSRMMLRVDESNFVKGFLVSKDKTRVSHLQVPNDSIFS